MIHQTILLDFDAALTLCVGDVVYVGVAVRPAGVVRRWWWRRNNRFTVIAVNADRVTLAKRPWWA